MKILQLASALALLLFSAPSHAATVELSSNGGFETGDLTDWTIFPSAGTVSVVSDPFEGSYAGKIEAAGAALNPLIKQANVGIGIVNPGDEVTIRFQAKGSATAGGVHFAEFFSELDGGGVSAAGILGGGPLFPGTDWTPYTFTAIAGPDVSGGVTLQLAAITSADGASTSTLFVDNVSITVEGVAIPEPASAALLGLGGFGMIMRRRRS